MLASIKNFFTNRKERKLDKYAKLIKNSKAIKEERIAALSYYADVKDANIAIPALLQRFEYSLEHGINDSKEKEMAFDSIMTFKEQALPYLSSHLKTTNRIAWPIKCLKSLCNDEQMVETFNSVLDFGDTHFNQDIIDKNYDILCYLREYKLSKNQIRKISHFLNDLDERVRFAACEVLLEQDDDIVAELLEKFVPDISSENRRLHEAVVEKFIEKKWRLKNPQVFSNGHVDGRLFVNGSGLLEIR